MDHRFLSIQSHVVSGYVGNKCAVFPLQVLGFEVDFINSVQFSNHTGYGKWKGQVLAEKDLDDLYEGLKENDLCVYTRLLTGYVGSESFLRKIASVISSIKKDNPRCIYLCDPVLGDQGHFYVPESLIPIYQKEILPLADITTPNTFELELLSGMKIKTEEEALKAINIIHDIGTPIVVLSSLDSTTPTLTTYVSQRKKGESKSTVCKLEYPKLEGVFTGTGDVFAALFLGWYTKLDGNISATISKTLATMETLLSRTRTKAETRNQADITKTSKPMELQLIQSLDIILQPQNERQVIQLSV